MTNYVIKHVELINEGWTDGLELLLLDYRINEKLCPARKPEIFTSRTIMTAPEAIRITIETFCKKKSCFELIPLSERTTKAELNGGLGFS